jgi:K+-transporting ATPase ATPase A chain
MSLQGAGELALYIAMLAILTKPLGTYMAAVFAGNRTWLDPVFGPVERLCYRVSGVDPKQEHGWREYGLAMLLFNGASLLLLYAILRTQQWLPLNPAGQSALDPALAWNTAVSFTTNTNWQNYGGETTLSYFSQMAGLTVHNFTSAATGMAIAAALIRSLARRSAKTLGNFWVDLTRSILYILLPIAFVLAIVLIWQGVPDNVNAYTSAVTVDGGTQLIAQGPVASQESIKELGTNGGGFFNTNSAHPYENPTALSDFLENLALLAIPAGLLYTFGKMVGDTRQGWTLWAASLVILVAGLVVVWAGEQTGNPLLSQLHVNQALTTLQGGGNLEGKEVRFGIPLSVLWAVTTTATSCGAVNAMLDSFTPIAGMIPLLNLQLGEVVFGGAGAGLYGLLMFAVLSVFIAGLLVGRTPEYLGKKIERFEIQMAMLAMLILAASILLFTAVASVLPAGVSATNNPGAHGFTEILYLYSSSTANNGSAFAGIGANTPFYNITGGLAMLVGRFLMIVPLMAMAGSLAAKKKVPPSLGTFPTTGPLWTGLLVGVIVIVGALTYFPALSLGPIVEQLQLINGSLS